MLTIREPIKLNIADGLTTCNDSFYERIVGNYGILNSAITPKDLLFYLSSPPELPDDLGGMTMFTANNSVTDKRSVSMNVLNNVINRILLSTEENFTYQDQVYIDSVLTKLGISDVSLFMKQAQELFEIHGSVKELINLYNQELSLRESGVGPEVEENKTSETAKSVEAQAEGKISPIFLHSDIYRRLDTKSIYSIINAFQSRQVHYAGAFSRNEIKTSEQLFASEILSLSMLRSRTAPDAPLTLSHFVNHYEFGDILPPPKNEEEVLSQAAAASLLSTVSHIITEKLYSGETKNHWLSLTQSLYETIENSISRFRSFHTEGPHMLAFWQENADHTIEHNKEESTVLRELVTMRRELSGISKSTASLSSASSEYPELTFVQNMEAYTSEGDISGDTLTNITPSTPGTSASSTERERIFRETSRELESIIRHEEAPGTILPESADIEYRSTEITNNPPTEELSPAEERKAKAERDRQITEKTREILSRGMPIKSERKVMPTLPSFSEPQEAKTVREIELEYGIRERTEKLSTLIYKVTPDNGQESDEEPSNHKTAQSSVPPSLNRVILDRLTTSENNITQNIIEKAENKLFIKENPEAHSAETSKASSYAPSAEETPPAEISYPVSDSEASPELISRELSEIDRRNRETLSHLRDTRLEKTVDHIPVPDKEKTLNLSLRALDSPESVLKEVLDAQQAVSHNTGKLSPEAQAYLANTDAVTRKLYESILGYEQNPQSQTEGLFHIGNVGELNAVAALQLAQRTPAETEESHIVDAISREKLTESHESVLEHFQAYPEKTQVIENSPLPPKVPIVHRFEQNDFSEELLERLEQQKTKVSTTQVQSDEINSSTMQEFTRNDLSSQTVTSSAEDITKLVNQTIAKQMNTISDKVYQQMERRLQTERNRRGRF